MNNSKTLEIAISRIEKVRRDKSHYLDLSGLNLKELPVDVSDLTYLLDLDLSYNQFINFPVEVAKLENLRQLNFSHNNLTDVYFEYGKYYCLRYLDISHNSLNYIPEDLYWLNNETEIIFNNNPFLDNLPFELIETNNLLYLQYYFDSFENNEIRPRLFETKLLIVGKGDVGKTTLMRVLQNYDYEVVVGKEQPTHGINVNYSHEGIYYPAKYPYYNKRTDHENIYIQEIVEEDEIDQENNAPKLTERYIHLSDYYYGFDVPLDYLISNEPYIEYHSDAFFEKEVKINIWDFGGQEILYATHQFFLTQRSIYLLVWDARTDNEDESFEYWLNIIERLGKSSPVIIVMNKSDVTTKYIDENYYVNRFSNIIGFVEVSCFNKNGIGELKRQIIETIHSFQHIGTELPKSWDRIRKAIAKCDKSYLSLSEFKELINVRVSEEINFITDFMHDLGDIIYFKDDYLLKDIIVLNPHWLTNAIYSLMNSLTIQKTHGLFRFRDLSLFLDVESYPEEKHFQIVALMEKFEICFNIVGANDMFIVPALLSPKSPINNFTVAFEIPESLKYNIEYNFLPSGIVERLICRLNSYLEKGSYWKYGAVLNTESSRAAFILNKGSKTMRVFIVGDRQSDLFTLIKHTIDQIHLELKLKDTDFVEMLVCRCHDCAIGSDPSLFTRNTLLKYLAKGKEYIECHNSMENIKINDLLIGYKSSFAQNILVRKFISAASKLQIRKVLLRNFNENQINLYFQDLISPLLKESSSIAKEQSLMGLSETGKNLGQIDMSIEKEGSTISIFEGFILRSIERNTISRHIEKTILNYDSNGFKEKYVGVYCRAKDFSFLSSKYLEYLNLDDKFMVDKNVVIGNSDDISDFYVQGSEIKLYRTKYKRSDRQQYLYHILINIYL